MIHLSYTELVGTAEKAFEALGMHPGERTDAAEMVAWLEMHDLAGVHELGKALAYLPAETGTRLQERWRTHNVRVYNAHGAGILGPGGLAVDAGVALANREGLATVRIEDCHNRALIVGYLARSANRGISVLAYWLNAGRSQACAVSRCAADDFPAFRVYETHESGETDQALTLILSKHFDLRPHFHEDIDADRIIRSIDAPQMQAARTYALENGLLVDRQVWDRLKELAAGVLVDDGR